MSSQTKTRTSSEVDKSSEKPAFNLNSSIQRIRAKWNASTRERREQTAKAMQIQLAAMLLGRDCLSHSID